MYPYLTLGDVTISLVGIGIILSFMYFLRSVYVQTRRYRLDFFRFFSFVPLLLFLCYFFGKRITFAKDHRWFPTTTQERTFFLDPHGLSFDFVGILLGAVIFFCVFFFYQPVRLHQAKRSYILYRAGSIALMIAGFFLIFGDGFMGKATESSFSILPLTENATSLAKFDKVYPLGLIFSFWIFISFLFVHAISYKTKKYHGRLGRAALFFVLTFVFPYQHYPQYGVRSVLGYTFDIKYYSVWILTLVCLILAMRSYHEDPPISGPLPVAYNDDL